MANGFLRVAFGVIYIPKNRVAAGDQKLSPGGDGCGFFCGAGLFVVERHVSEDDQKPCFTPRIAKLFKKF